MSKSTKALIQGCYYCMFVGGVALMLIGSVLPYLIEKYGMNYNTAGLLVSLQAFGILGAGFASGFFSQLFGKRVSLVTGVILITAGYCAVPFAPSVFWLFVFVILGGIGYGFLNNMTNSMVNDSTGSNPFSLSILHASFAVGSTITPFIVMMFIANGKGWDNTLIVYGAIGLASIAAASLIPIKDSKTTVKQDKMLDFTYLKDNKYLVLSLLVFFITGFQTSLFGWLITYFIKLGILSEVISQSVISMLWGTMIIGRLSCSFLSRRFKIEKLLIFTCIFTFALFAACFIFMRSSFMVPLLLVMGLFMAGVYPLIVSNSGKIIQNKATASGLLFAFSGLGGVLVSYLVGLTADLFGIGASMYVMLFSALVMAVLAVINYVMTSNSPKTLSEQIKEPESPQAV